MPPLPKRSTERRRRNAVPGETVVKLDGEVKPPRLPGRLHPVARGWYNSLKASGQQEFFEPSDWQIAVFVAIKLSGHLSGSRVADRMLGIADQIMLIDEDLAKDLRELAEDVPRGSASEFAALCSAMDSLLTTESSRRRARLEVERGTPDESENKPTSIAARRKALQG